MLRYLIKRVLLFIPTLLIISLLAFGLSKLAPGDPIGEREDPRLSLGDQERIYRETARLWGLDKPVFYFGIASAAYPDTLYRFVLRDQRSALSKLIGQYGNWNEIAAYRENLEQTDARWSNPPDAIQSNKLSMLRGNLRSLYLQHRDARITSILDTLQSLINRDSALQAFANADLEQLQSSYERIKTNATPGRLLVPDFKWYGVDNQYHNWFMDFLQGDFGTSYIDGRPVASKLWDALSWTLIVNGTAIFIAYLLSIPLGVFSAVRKDTRWDRFISVSLFLLYSLPTFWIATMLIVFFTTPEYGMDWFPSIGVGNLPDDASFVEQFTSAAAHLVLPIFCMTYGALAFISRQMRGGMVDVLQQDYIRTARAKGLPEGKITWKHAFRNALFPIVTLFASVFPLALSGSVVIEVIFNIPGMGKLTIDSINNRDYPVVYAVLMLSAILTMIGILVADILYAWLDPRVAYAKRQK